MYNFKLQLLAHKNQFTKSLKGNYQDEHFQYDNKGVR